MCSKITVTCTTTRTAKPACAQWLQKFQLKDASHQEEQHHKLCELRCYVVGNTSDEAIPCNCSSCRHQDAHAQGLSTHIGVTLPVFS